MEKKLWTLPGIISWSGKGIGSRRIKINQSIQTSLSIYDHLLIYLSKYFNQAIYIFFVSFLFFHRSRPFGKVWMEYLSFPCFLPWKVASLSQAMSLSIYLSTYLAFFLAFFYSLELKMCRKLKKKIIYIIHHRPDWFSEVFYIGIMLFFVY